MLRVRSIIFLLVHEVAKSSTYPLGDTLTALIEQHKFEFSNSTQWAQILPECYMNVQFWSEYS